MQNQWDLVVALRSAPLAIDPASASRLFALAERAAFGAGRPTASTQRAVGRSRPVARTAVIPIVGTLTQHRTAFEALGFAWASCDTIRSQLRAAIASPDVDRVLLELDSPGGSVFGLIELAAEIRAARGIKPIIGVANSMAASAAYWIGSQCSELYCTPSGQVGSIGVIAAHEDVSKALEIAGVKITTISAGSHKNEGSPFAPLDREARAEMQRQVDGYGRDFVRDVALGRGVSISTVDRNFGQGRTLSAIDAKTAGMIDGVATLDEVLTGRARPTARINANTFARLPAALARSMRELDLLQ